MVNDPRQYEVLQKLGAGGFGTVYRARFVGDVGFSKEVALKVLNADMVEVDEIAARLRDEARVLGLLRHRAIVHVDRLALLDGRWTIVMEYVEGVSLARLIRQGAVPVAAALEVVSEVAAALHVAYTRPGPSGQPLHLLHRDIKPSNIQLTPYGEVKVLDFGIARAEFEARESQTRSLSYGTPEYMSPERLDHAADGPEGDVYALGAVLLEMITGRAIGRSSARQDKHEARVRDALAGLDPIPDVTPAVRALIVAMLGWDPSARPTAGDVERIAVRLRNLYHDEPLRTWTEVVIPPLLAAPVLVEESASVAREDLSGVTLTERLSAGAVRRAPAGNPPEVPSIPTLEGVPRDMGGQVQAVASSGVSQPAHRSPETATSTRPDRTGWRWGFALALGALAALSISVTVYALWRWVGSGPTPPTDQETSGLGSAPTSATVSQSPALEPAAPPAVDAPQSSTAPEPVASPEAPVGPAAAPATRPSTSGRAGGRSSVPAPSIVPAPAPATVQIGRTDGALVWIDGQTEILATGTSATLAAERVVVKYRFDDSGVQQVEQQMASGDIWLVQCLATTAQCRLFKLDGKDLP